MPPPPATLFFAACCFDIFAIVASAASLLSSARAALIARFLLRPQADASSLRLCGFLLLLRFDAIFLHFMILC